MPNENIEKNEGILYLMMLDSTMQGEAKSERHEA